MNNEDVIENDENEKSYIQGSATANILMIQYCLNNLGYKHDNLKELNFIQERQFTIGLLRELCKDFGDNDWDDSLNLYDIVDKHLARHLYDDKEDQ